MASVPSYPRSNGGDVIVTAADMVATTVTPQQNRNNHPKKKTNVHASSLTGVDRRMAVDKNVVDELLLVCGVIGTETTTSENNNGGEQKLVPVTDCLNWLQDLQRALRRDEDLYRPISLLLGSWNVVQKKLLPLVLTCRYDNAMVLTIVKILVILTKPLHENTLRAGRLVIDTKSNKKNEEVIQEQKKLRANALAQSELLVEYKRAIVHHPSHRHGNSKITKAGSANKQEGGLLSIFVSLLAEPLSKTGTKRTDADHLTIELVLHLFRNILSADPIVKGSQETSLKSAQLHNECISLFEKELVLDILMVICQEMELRENAQYNLLMMELLQHLLKSQDPTAVARCMIPDTTVKLAANSSKATKEKENSNSNSKEMPTTKPSAQSQHGNSITAGVLRARLARDKQQFRTGAPARHGNFGGTLMVKRPDGKQRYVSASAVLNRSSKNSAPGVATNSGAGPKKRKNRKTEPFIGSGRTLLAHTRVEQTQNSHRGPAAIRARKTLYRFCQMFLEKCYGPVMKSLKNEFRRDSVRLEGDDDKVVFFRIIWFFFQWFRVSGFKNELKQSSNDTQEGDKQASLGTTALGQLIFTMDVFSFNLVLNATTTFTTHKNYVRLAQTVSLYAEMMHMLNSMYHSEDSTEQIMALGLMDRLFYGGEPIDRLPKLLSSWIPGTTTRDYVCDMVEICHMTLKLLEANKKASADIMESEEARQAIVNKKGKKIKIQTNDPVLQMKIAASDFEVNTYFARKIVSNNVVFMYAKLLDQYALNSNQVNHRIVAFFLRLAKVKIVDGEDNPTQHIHPDGSGPMENLLAPKTTTLEPMLYNMHLILVLNKILNDPLIRNDKSYATTLSWAAGVIHNFATAATTVNPMLFVESLFKHPVPQRFCEMSTNLYVSEELRMIAERELLLEVQRLEALAGDQSDDEDDMDQDEELEFVDMEESEPSQKAKKKRGTDADSFASEDENDGDEGHSRTPKVVAKKRRLQLQKGAKSHVEDSSDEEELEFEMDAPEAPSAPKVAARQKKNKLTKKSVDDSDEEDVFAEEKDESSPDVSSSEKVKKARMTSLDDSSDEEIDFGESKNAVRSRRPAFDESDEDEDEKEIEDLAEQAKQEREKLKAIVDANSSDEEDESLDSPVEEDEKEIEDLAEQAKQEREKLKAITDANSSDEEDESLESPVTTGNDTAEDATQE